MKAGRGIMRSRKEDQALLKTLRRGNPDALRIVYEKYKKDMLAVALALASDRSVAEDVVHDVFVSFAGIARDLKIRRSLKSYLLTSVVHRLRNAARSASRSAASLGPSEAANPVSDPPEAPAMAPLERDRLSRALAALPEPQRNVIVLHVMEGLKFRAIARSQRESINTVQSRYRYGIRKMRNLFLEGNGDGE
jgi:RNA polymerase sigma factor (sigma-70 family)